MDIYRYRYNEELLPHPSLPPTRLYFLIEHDRKSLGCLSYAYVYVPIKNVRCCYIPVSHCVRLAKLVETIERVGLDKWHYSGPIYTCAVFDKRPSFRFAIYSNQRCGYYSVLNCISLSYHKENIQGKEKRLEILSVKYKIEANDSSRSLYPKL